MTFEIDVQGLDALNAKLKSVTEDMRKKGGRSALRKAANLIRDEAKKNAKRIDDPLTPNDISENIAVRWNGKLYKRRGDIGFRIGVRGGARQYSATDDNRRKRRVGQEYFMPGDSGNPGGDTFYWRFVEFGTSRAPARPFMRPALADNIGKATTVFVKEYDKAIDRAIKRAAKK